MERQAWGYLRRLEALEGRFIQIFSVRFTGRALRLTGFLLAPPASTMHHGCLRTPPPASESRVIDAPFAPVRPCPAVVNPGAILPALPVLRGSSYSQDTKLHHEDAAARVAPRFGAGAPHGIWPAAARGRSAFEPFKKLTLVTPRPISVTPSNSPSRRSPLKRRKRDDTVSATRSNLDSESGVCHCRKFVCKVCKSRPRARSVDTFY